MARANRMTAQVSAANSRGTKSKPKAKSRTSKKGESTNNKRTSKSKFENDTRAQLPTPNSSNSGSQAANEPEKKQQREWIGSGPDPNEWDDRNFYKIYKSFRRGGPGESIFVNDYVYVWGVEGDDDYINQSKRIRWLGKVCDIRAKAKDRVFLEIAWLFTSTAQLKDSKIIFPRKRLAKNEVVSSSSDDFKDIINVWCVEEPATVKRFDEMDPWQEEIRSDDEYYRSEIISDSAGRMRVKQFQPLPAGSKKPYMPYTTAMVYCPRPSCLKWHHQSLIKKIPAPDTEQIISMRSSGLELLDSRPPSKNDPNSSTTPSEEETAVSEDEILRRWVKIERTASSSITRGKKSIVGNTVPVIEAREIMALEDEDDKAEEMEKLITAWMMKYDSRSRAKRAMEGDTNTEEGGGGGVVEDGYETDEDEVEQVERWICPGCREVI